MITAAIAAATPVPNPDALFIARLRGRTKKTSPREGGLGSAYRTRSIAAVFKEALESFGARRVAQLAQGLRLDLANPLARDIELFADFL